MPIPDYIQLYWGKAQPSENDRVQWHPLAYHSLDVAAVADVLLRRDPRRLERMSKCVGAQSYDLHGVLVFLVALHDVGKFSRHFQAKSDLGPLGALPAPTPGARHDAIGYALLTDIEFELDALLSPCLDVASDAPPMLAAVTGHHGSPALDAGNRWKEGFGSRELKDVRAFVSGLIDLLQPPSLQKLKSRAKILSWHLAGFTNLCDWIGSSHKWFPYAKPDMHLAGYWTKAVKQAEIAVNEAGILPSDCPAEVSPAHLLPHITEDSLSPLQRTAHACALPEGPMLAIIEDVTGVGKTEAALLIAARLMVERRASGLFFSLPTMATANAMYGRLATSYRRLFEANATPSLVLAHGKRGLHDGFRDSILDMNAENDLQTTAREQEDETPADMSASAACAAWIADDRRKAFLADVGIGTVDQALLGVLPSRFQSLRLWGLADRVLIVDEAHTYDSYVSRELETLLEFQAALGGSAVVLSATLSTAARNRLAAAFRRGLGSNPEEITAGAYPLLSLISTAGVVSIPVETRPEIARTLAVKRIQSMDDAIGHVVDLAKRGACVAWIRNAVDDATEAAALLGTQGLEPILLHSRFAMSDRLEIEERVKCLLGKDSTPETRRDARGNGLVVVGSQILEASLDYDVDGMISDLAPIDMLIQRAGRLWRHPSRNRLRPIGADERAFVLLSPDPADVQDKDWYRTLSKRAAAVYADHGNVWRTATSLEAIKSISTPVGIRRLLSDVYDQDDAPRVLQRAALDADGQRLAARSIATNASLQVSRGYGGNNVLFASDDVVSTRLGESLVSFRLARRENGSIVPWCPREAAGGSLARAWALSECSVRQKTASGVPAPSPSLAKDVAAAKATWGKWEHDHPLLVLEPFDGDVWKGRVLTDKGERDVLYDRALGWRMHEFPANAGLNRVRAGL